MVKNCIPTIAQITGEHFWGPLFKGWWAGAKFLKKLRNAYFWLKNEEHMHNKNYICASTMGEMGQRQPQERQPQQKQPQ